MHRWQYLGQVLDDEVTVGDLFTVQLHERQEPPLAPQLAIVVDVLQKKIQNEILRNRKLLYFLIINY